MRRRYNCKWRVWGDGDVRVFVRKATAVRHMRQHPLGNELMLATHRNWQRWRATGRGTVFRL